MNVAALTRAQLQSFWARGWVRFSPVDTHLKCECGRPAVHFEAHGRSCARCYEIGQRMEEFHWHNRDNFETEPQDHGI